MSVIVKVFPEPKLVIVRFFGDVIFEDLGSALKAVQNDPNFKPSFLGVTDLRTVEFKVAPKVLAQFFEDHVKTKQNANRWAYLVVQPKETALAYFYTNLFNSDKRKCFSTCLGASSYLGVNIEPFLNQMPIPT